jgi:hypothetical protein
LQEIARKYIAFPLTLDVLYTKERKAVPVKAICVLSLCAATAFIFSVYRTSKVKVKAIDLVGYSFQRDRPYEIKFTEE